MKQNVRRALAISGIAVVIGTTGFTYGAEAKTETKTFKTIHKKEVLSKKTHRKTLRGVVTSVSSNSLEFKRGNKTFTANTTSETKVFDLKWNKISFGDIKTGDRIKVSGAISETTITAQTLRDLSLNKS